jgi:hypothetical protein
MGEPRTGETTTRDALSAFDLLRRPEVSYDQVVELIGPMDKADDDRLDAQIRTQLEVAAKYSGYIERQEERSRASDATRKRGSPPTSTTRASAASPTRYGRNSNRFVPPRWAGRARRRRDARGGVHPASASQESRAPPDARTSRDAGPARAAASLAVTACGSATRPAETAAILLRGNGPDPDSLDPHKARSTEVDGRCCAICSKASRGSTATPRRAGRRRELDGQRRRPRLHLQAAPNLRWSSGEPLVAEDFVAGLQRLVDPATASQYAQVINVILNAPDIVAGKKPVDSLGVAAPDTQTFRDYPEQPGPLSYRPHGASFDGTTASPVVRKIR